MYGFAEKHSATSNDTMMICLIMLDAHTKHWLHNYQTSIISCQYLGLSKNSRKKKPKWMVKIMENPKTLVFNGWFGEFSPTIFRNHLFQQNYLSNSTFSGQQVWCLAIQMRSWHPLKMEGGIKDLTWIAVANMAFAKKQTIWDIWYNYVFTHLDV